MVAEKADPWELDFGPGAPGKSDPTPRPYLRFRVTLLELVVAIVTVGILGALMLPSIISTGHRDYSRVLPPKPDRMPDSGLAGIGGEYYRGDGLGMNWHLDLTADGRYSFVWSGCLGVYEKDCGYVRIRDGKVYLSPAKPTPGPSPSGKPWLQRIPTGLRIVRWGTRRYLIPDEDAGAFCEAIREGREPRTDCHGRFFLADALLENDDLKRSVDGLPTVPDSWGAMMPERPKVADDER